MTAGQAGAGRFIDCEEESGFARLKALAGGCRPAGGAFTMSETSLHKRAKRRAGRPVAYA
jgi:hypothetical protein